MIRRVSSCIALALAMTAGIATGQSRASVPASLQRWVVTGGEHNGRPMDAIKGGVLSITGDGFELRTASGNLLKGTLHVDAGQRPNQIDLLHADGVKWEAIYEANGDALKLNYVEAGSKDVRPVTFTTSGATEASIVTLRRESR
jgi:uncharacterized protein (TIGR03067 family)